MPLTVPGFGDIVTPLKWHGRRRTRKSGTQRGACMVKAPCVRGGGTTPEPPGKGPGRDPPVTVGHKRQDVKPCPGRSALWCHAARPPRRPTVLRSAENTAGLCPSCFSVCAAHCCPAPGRSALRCHVSPARDARLPDHSGWCPGPTGPPLALAPVHPCCSRRLKRFLQAGWNRGTYVSPLNQHQGWGFLLPAPEY